MIKLMLFLKTFLFVGSFKVSEKDHNLRKKNMRKMKHFLQKWNQMKLKIKLQKIIIIIICTNFYFNICISFIWLHVLISVIGVLKNTLELKLYFMNKFRSVVLVSQYN